MENKDSKTNGILVGMFLYVLIFGIKVDTNNGVVTQVDSTCEPITAPVIEPPPNIPIIQKEYLTDKTYVIRVLVNHINSLNKHISQTTKQTTEIYNTYTKCVVP